MRWFGGAFGRGLLGRSLWDMLGGVCVGEGNGRGKKGGKVTKTDGSTDGRSETGSCGEGDVQGVFVAFPFFEREDAAEGGEAETDCFVGAEGLSVIWTCISILVHVCLRINLHVSLKVQSRSPVIFPLIRL